MASTDVPTVDRSCVLASDGTHGPVVWRLRIRKQTMVLSGDEMDELVAQHAALQRRAEWGATRP